MKARILKNSSEIHMLLCNGKIKKVTDNEVRSFFSTYKNPEHYEGPDTWDYELSMEDYAGETIAVVDDDEHLIIYDADYFATILEMPMTYLSVADFAKKHGRQPAIVRRLCMNGRIKGGSHTYF